MISYFFCLRYDRDLVYVDLSIVFKNFEMSMELDKKYHNYVADKSIILDSLDVVRMELFSQGQSSESIDIYILDIQSSLVKVKDQFDEQIWNQLNQYLLDYGKLNNYRFIFGAQGNGNMVYAKENLNVTEEVVDFVNFKYKGK